MNHGLTQMCFVHFGILIKRGWNESRTGVDLKIAFTFNDLCGDILLVLIKILQFESLKSLVVIKSSLSAEPPQELKFEKLFLSFVQLYSIRVDGMLLWNSFL